jgi:hypothetical protein
MDTTNLLFYGDNLRVLREEVGDETVDLVYLDPPFNSAANYNVLFREASGEQSAAQIMAFEDTWHWTHESEATYQELVTDAPERLARLVEAMRQMLGTSDMMAYLVMMAPRLLFCGCGTTINVAERLKRRWIGIDITHLAVALIQNRLRETFGTELSAYEVRGTPTDTASAEALALQDRYQFQWWALSLIGARPAQDKKKGKDSGIDGLIRYLEREGEPARTIIVQVKSGKVSSRDIRDLVGVLDREKAVIGVLITLQPPTRDMTKEAVSAGLYSSPWGNFPRLQILTVEDLLSGRDTAQYPRLNAATFKRAERKRRTQGEQTGLF